MQVKTRGWKEYYTGQTRETTWDKIYRIMKKPGQMEEPMFKNTPGNIRNPEETTKLLASTFYPQGKLDTDNEYYNAISCKVKEHRNGR